MGTERTIDVKVIFREHFGSIVNRVSGPVENTAQHVFRNRELHAAARKLNVGRLNINTRCSFKDLHNGLLSLNFEHLPAAFCSVRQRQLYDLIVRGKLRRTRGRSSVSGFFLP